jgi:hypothetical protein
LAAKVSCAFVRITNADYFSTERAAVFRILWATSLLRISAGEMRGLRFRLGFLPVRQEIRLKIGVVSKAPGYCCPIQFANLANRETLVFASGFRVRKLTVRTILIAVAVATSKKASLKN